ncbi:MAG: carotenoid biosynthesis protein [Flavobacteriales bacterium]|nr:carotenoid biosynthesis protein [Flavobacteriales bacterium]
MLAIFGLSKSKEGIFVLLTVPSLLTTAIALFVNHIGERNKVILHLVCFTLAFFLIELLIMQFGLFNKTYAKELLGYKFMGVPLVIGLSGWISVYMGVHLVKKLKMNRVKKALIGATLLMILTALAEPVGVKLKLWSYQGELGPLNLFGYFLVYTLMIYFSRLIRFKKKNPIVGPVFIIFVLFFISLNLILS